MLKAGAAMKIGFVLNQFPELSQTFVLDQVLGLKARGHEVEVIAGCPGASSGRGTHGHDWTTVQDITTWANMPVHLARRALHASRLSAKLAIRHPKKLARCCDVSRYGWFAATGTLICMASPLLDRPRRYDAIIAHFGPQGVIAMGLRELGLIEGPLVTYFHAYDLTSAPRTAGRTMYRRLFAQGERMLGISERGRQLLVELGARPASIRVHHMGVDLEQFKAQSRESNGGTLLRVLSVGRLCEKKGFLWALDAVALAHAQGLNLTWTIVGEGPFRAKLEQRIKRLRLTSMVRLVGAQSRPQVIQALKSHDALLVPSIIARNQDEEGIPMVLMEAMACSLPVIATRNGGIEELVTDNQTGLLIDQLDVPALSKALSSLVAEPEQSVVRVAQARSKIEAQFSLATQLDELERILTELKSSSEKRARLH